VEVPAPQPAETPPTLIEAAPTPTVAPVEERSWHLVDLLLVVFTLTLGFFLMAYAIRRRDEYDEQFVPEERQDIIKERQIGMWGQLGIVLGIVSVAALLLTQDFSADMNIVDTWTVLFAVICGACLLAAIGVTSGAEREGSGNDAYEADMSDAERNNI
jgi:drug/metabolite transporter (DMT)-like permease